LFLGNGRETDNGTKSVARQQIISKQEQTAAARERLGKHVPAATNTHTKIKDIVCAAVPKSCKKDNWGNQISEEKSQLEESSHPERT
jgi:cytochrome c5